MFTMCTIIAEFDKDGRPYQQINEEELKESLRCEMLENCTPQFCCTCQEKFSSQVDSKAHYDGKPHQKLLQIKLKIMLRKKINEENSRKKLGDCKFINSGDSIATEISQIEGADMSGVKNSIKAETQKRLGDHLDESFDLAFNLDKCQPNYCGVCFTNLNENDSEPHYSGKPHKKKLKLLGMVPNPINFTCNLCQISASSEVDLQIHRQGSKHKSREAQQEPLRTHSGIKGVKTEQAISVQCMKSGCSLQKENMNGLYCDVCDVTGSSEMNLNQHLNGKAHKKKLASLEKQKYEERKNQEMLATHLNGIAHHDKRGLTFTCDLCQVFCNSQERLESHLNGKLHKKKEKKISAAHVQVVSHVSSEEPPEQENVEELDDDGEIKDIPDSMISKPVEQNDTDKESMSLQTVVKMNEITSEKCKTKDELKIKLEEKELLHAVEIEQSSTSKSYKEEDIVLVTENIEVKKSAKKDDECEEEARSDDDLIILENPDCLSPQKSIQKTLNKVPLVESVKLCVYPLGQSESVSLSTQDYATLAYDTFLNDIIIDFYLLYLANNVLSNNNREKVHIFSTMFYKRLLQSPRADAKKVPEYENDASLTPSEIRHFRVASWTKNVDLFEKDMLIIPICEEFHWYLLLVVKPGVIFLPFETRERKEKGEPFMIVLDSVGGRNNSSAKNIRRYLACEWNKRKCGGAELLSNLEQRGKKMGKLRPKKPEQENNSDCGIFLLQYVETVFKNVSAFMWPFLVNMRTKEWFTSQEVAGKRGEIAELIKRLTKEQKPGEVIEYPNIKFTAKGVEGVKEGGSKVKCT